MYVCMCPACIYGWLKAGLEAVLAELHVRAITSISAQKGYWLAFKSVVQGLEPSHKHTLACTRTYLCCSHTYTNLLTYTDTHTQAQTLNQAHTTSLTHTNTHSIPHARLH
jgi:carbohydrate-binding DOMON domain-containing protein